MKIDGICSIVCAAISEVQALSGRSAESLQPSTKPIGDMDGFDSLCSIETTVLIEQQLSVDLGMESIFISRDGRRALTIDETCAVIKSIVDSRELK